MATSSPRTSPPARQPGPRPCASRSGATTSGPSHRPHRATSPWPAVGRRGRRSRRRPRRPPVGASLGRIMAGRRLRPTRGPLRRGRRGRPPPPAPPRCGGRRVGADRAGTARCRRGRGRSGPDVARLGDGDTTHLCAMDGDGLGISLTQSNALGLRVRTSSNPPPASSCTTAASASPSWQATPPRWRRAGGRPTPCPRCWSPAPRAP